MVLRFRSYCCRHVSTTSDEGVRRVEDQQIRHLALQSVQGLPTAVLVQEPVAAAVAAAAVAAAEAVVKCWRLILVCLHID